MAFMDVYALACLVPVEIQRGHLDSLELELQMVVNTLWMLGNEPGPLGEEMALQLRALAAFSNLSVHTDVLPEKPHLVLSASHCSMTAR